MAFAVQKNHLRTSTDWYPILKWLTHKCKNLYNSALYLIKTHFTQTGKYLSGKQLFQQIPYAKFKENLKSKAELYGIKVHLVDEAYTSQTCSGCGAIRKANRVKRGLYRCSTCGLQLNADINAAINILRKVAPNGLAKWSSGDIISPKRLRLVSFSA